MFQDNVFCFTPKGEVIKLPREATPIDFAYAVHTKIGDTAIACEINGKDSPLQSALHNGDVVIIITSKNRFLLKKYDFTLPQMGLQGVNHYEIYKLY